MLNNDKSESIAIIALAIMFLINCMTMKDVAINGAIVGAVCGMLIKSTKPDKKANV